MRRGGEGRGGERRGGERGEGRRGEERERGREGVCFYSPVHMVCKLHYTCACADVV